MKILAISIYPFKGEKNSKTGGVAAYTQSLLLNLPLSKMDRLFVLCDKVDGKRSSYIENNISVVRGFSRNPSFIFSVIKEVQQIKPDIIHLQQELSLFGNILTSFLLQVLIMTLRFMGYNVVTTLHGVVSINSIDRAFIKENNSNLPVPLVKTAFYLIYRPICFWSKHIIVHESPFKTTLCSEYGVKTTKVSVVHLGIEDLKGVSKDVAGKKLKIDPQKEIVLFMGYLTGYKGIDLLIESFALLSAKNKKAFLIIGAGKHPKLSNDPKYLKEYNRIVQKASTLLRADSYKWVGFIHEKNILDYYSLADISVYPYTVSMSSSGPMAFSIGMEKAFLASDVFGNVFSEKQILFRRDATVLCDKLLLFFKDDKSKIISIIHQLKTERSLESVGVKTYEIYRRQK